MGLVNVDAPKVGIQRQTQSGPSPVSVCRQKQEKLNQNKSFKCSKAAVSLVKTHKLLV